MQLALPTARRTRPRLVRGLGVLTSTRTGILGSSLVVALVVMSFLGPFFIPSPYVSDVSQIYQPPSASHLLGTDFAGRDNLALIVYGGADIILLAVATGLLTTFIAAMIGAVAAYSGGIIDTILTGLTDIWLTIPRFILLVVIASLVRIDSTLALATLLALFSWPALARLIRSQVLSLKRREYIEAARLLDLGSPHIIGREMLPNMMSFIVISAIGGMTQAIYAQTGLVFLGIVPLGNNWGVLFSLAYAKNAMYSPTAAWSLLAPIGAIILFQLSLVLVARTLEEAFNPRLRAEQK